MVKWNLYLLLEPLFARNNTSMQQYIYACITLNFKFSCIESSWILSLRHRTLIYKPMCHRDPARNLRLVMYIATTLDSFMSDVR